MGRFIVTFRKSRREKMQTHKLSCISRLDMGIGNDELPFIERIRVFAWKLEAGYILCLSWHQQKEIISMHN
jgi:hypothetical protein